MKRLVLISILGIALMITVSAATVVYYHYHKQTWNVESAPEFTEYLDGLQWSNGTDISWGKVEKGQIYTKNYTVVNTGNTPITVIFRVEGLPSAYSLTWAANGTELDPGQAAKGDLTLAVPESATDGEGNCNTWLEAHK